MTNSGGWKLHCVCLTTTKRQFFLITSTSITNTFVSYCYFTLKDEQQQLQLSWIFGVHNRDSGMTNSFSILPVRLSFAPSILRSAFRKNKKKRIPNNYFRSNIFPESRNNPIPDKKKIAKKQISIKKFNRYFCNTVRIIHLFLVGKFCCCKCEMR